MKRFLCLVVSFLTIFSTACSVPAESTTSTVASSESASQTPETSGTVDAFTAALQAADTVEEVGVLMKPYIGSKDYTHALRCVDRMMELDPESQDVWYAQAELRILMLQLQYEELNDIIEQGVKHIDDPAVYTEWISTYLSQSALAVILPFTPDYSSADEINTYGIASSNYSNGGGVYNTWQNGLLTSQGDWVYFSVPAEDYAIYKMRFSGEDKQRISDDRGCFLNVVGDWIYYCNITDNNSIYKMRTDGSKRTQVADETCVYLAVCGDWIVYANSGAEDRLYKMRLDGSEVSLVWDSPVRYPYISGDRMYFMLRDGKGFCSVALDGSDMRVLALQRVEGYCIEEAWIYYITDNNGMVVEKMRLDGSEQTEVLRFAGKGGIISCADGQIIVGGMLEGSDHEQVVSIDPDTMAATVLIDEWCEALYTAGGMVYFLDYEEGNAWYYLDLANGDSGKLQ